MEKEPEIYPVANEKRSGTGVDNKKPEKQPIVDIEVDTTILEAWEKKGLPGVIEDLVFGFEDLVPPGGKFGLHEANFASTYEFMRKTEEEFGRFKGAKNMQAKIKEVEDLVRKVILNFTFKELEFDPRNPEIIKSEEIEVYPVKPGEAGAAEQLYNGEESNGEKTKLIINYYKTNQSDIILAYDGIDWWLELEKKLNNS